MREGESAARIRAGLEAATAAGFAVLGQGGPALDAVVEAVASLESSGCFNAGLGAVPTDDGTFEFDASVMDATSGLVGAICAATYPASPIRAARAVAEAGGVPDGPVLLAGTGADLFCRRAGLEALDHGRLGARTRASSDGTVGAVALDENGNLAAATSTGGRSGQVRGRVGDSPIPGAGVLALPSVAVSATGAGEAFMVAGFSHRVAWALEQGEDIEAAMEGALEAVARLHGAGGAIALTRDGHYSVAFTTTAMARAWRGGNSASEAVHPS